jgi:uncharacterized membrane protein YkvA (DUF1232 family)
MTALQTIRDCARRLKRDAITLWFACKNPATPWLPKVLCGFVVAYALSPIDLIPDFIPVLGYLDDLLLLPALIWIAVKLLPPGVVKESRAQAEQWMTTQGAKPRSYVGAALIIAVWFGVAGLAGYWFFAR